MPAPPNPRGRTRTDHWPNIIVVFSGGNALGAFHAGAYEALHRQGLRANWLVGSSIGAITAALIAGNAEEERVARLREFWQAAAQPALLPASHKGAKLAAAIQTRLVGRPGLFEPTVPRLLADVPFGVPALYHTHALERTLPRLVDFDRIATAPCRLAVTATDLHNGDLVIFRSDRERIEVAHLRASTALPGDFEPVTIDGHVLGDGGLTANLPVAAALAMGLEDDTLCIAVDAMDARARDLTTLDDLNQRRSDLVFAAQAGRDIEIARLRYELATARGEALPAVTVAHVVYAGNDTEAAQKEFDYSASSIATRWAAGRSQMEHALTEIDRAGHPGGFTLLNAGARA